MTEAADWTALCRNSLSAYACAVNEDYRANQFTRLIATKLEDVLEGRCQRLMIFAPPRHGKSLTVSKLFPAYAFGRRPRRDIVFGSYAQDIADDMGRAVKGYMKSEVHRAIFPGSGVSTESDSVRRFHTTQGGAYFAVGVGGPVTGRGGHILILDDPYKNREEADSPVVQATVQNWYKSTFRTRLQSGDPPGGIVIIQTRWNDRDLVRMILKMSQESGEQPWTIVDLPAEATLDGYYNWYDSTLPKDALGRAKGEPLVPELFSASDLKAIRAEVGERDWFALFQQRPFSQEGGIFKREWVLRYCSADWPCPAGDKPGACGLPTLPTDEGRNVASWDMAFKEKLDTDYVVGIVALATSKQLWLKDRWKDRADLPASCAAVLEMQQRIRCGQVWVEAKANGPAVVQTVSGVDPAVRESEPYGSKEGRWHAAAPYFRAGKVLVPHNAPWAEDFISCLTSVPDGEFDDDADSVSQLVLQVFGSPIAGVLDWMKRKAEVVLERQRIQHGGSREGDAATTEAAQRDGTIQTDISGMARDGTGAAASEQIN